MKKTIYTIYGIALLAIMSCGPNAEQKAAAEKAKMDSVANATKNQIANEKAKQDSLASTEANKIADEAMNEEKQSQLKSDLVQFKAQLATAEAKMEDIKTFHIGRAQSEKEQQIGDQTAVIENLKNQISDTEKQIK